MTGVILAGGAGTRISEETIVRPKPMIEIGNKPMLWHIMKLYSAHGINDFVICLGYRGYMIKEFFANYFLHTCDVSFDIAKNSMEVHESTTEPWRVTLVDTGEETQTGGRPRRVQRYLDSAVEEVVVDPSFWRARRVLVTGHTGFKGSWLCLWLQRLGAEVIGYATGSPSNPCMYDLAGIGTAMASIQGDIRDTEAVRDAFAV